MKKLLLSLALLLPATAVFAQKAQSAATHYADSIKFHFATVSEARKLMGADDDFARGWSQFDITSRLQNPKGTKAELLAMKQNEVREWTQAEKDTILNDMYEMNRILRQQNYQLPLPNEVILVKSTLNDEGQAAGYTQANWIALTDKISKGMSPKFRKELLLHELSHILTRNSEVYKKHLYACIDFEIAGPNMEYPAELLEKRISNPDIAAYDSYAPFTVNGKTEKCAMYLYADRPYTKGLFFEYVKVAFVPYDNQLKAKRDANGKLIVYSMDEVKDFFDHVGKNTNYIIHPEEILAENFVTAYLNTPNLPSPQIQKRVRQVLLGNWK